MENGLILLHNDEDFRRIRRGIKTLKDTSG